MPYRHDGIQHTKPGTTKNPGNMGLLRDIRGVFCLGYLSDIQVLPNRITRINFLKKGN